MIINGTSGIDNLFANKDDQVFGFEGDDILDASNGEGNNLLEGGLGSDRLFANNDDTLRGGAGEDTLYALGSLGFNTLAGGDDNDELFVVEGGNNELDGGDGRDRLTVLDGSGNNNLSGGLGNDFLDVSNGTGNNILDGDEGDDILIGGVGSDRLFAGAGDDLLFGGTKGSQLTGGTGADRFFLTSAAIPEVPIEVLDFTQNQDKVIVAGIPQVRSFEDLQLDQQGNDTIVKANIDGTIRELGILRNVQAKSLTPLDFNYTASIFAISNASATEGNSITFVITRTGDTQTQQSVTVSTSVGAGNTASTSDFVSKTETLIFQPGDTQKTFTVQTTQDFIVEGNETFTVSLSNPTNEAILSPTNATAKGTINNDDTAGVTITQTDGDTITEEGETDSYCSEKLT
ncbi:MAG TPA: Calx-beta domain-containing protein [Leptolyngbyaceae cyanobacterium]